MNIKKIILRYLDMHSICLRAFITFKKLLRHLTSEQGRQKDVKQKLLKKFQYTPLSSKKISNYYENL